MGTHHVKVTPKPGWIVSTPKGIGVITELGENQVRVGDLWFDYADVVVEKIVEEASIMSEGDFVNEFDGLPDDYKDDEF